MELSTNQKLGLPFRSWANKPKVKDMDVILTEKELKEAVEQYLRPRMKFHDIQEVQIREVKISNNKRLEVLATLKEKKDGKS